MLIGCFVFWFLILFINLQLKNVGGIIKSSIRLGNMMMKEDIHVATQTELSSCNHLF